MDQQTLKTLISYNPDTGQLTRLKATTTHQSVGDVIQTPTFSLYRKSYSTFNMIWLYMTGELPSSRVFTLDGDNTNLVFSNLTNAHVIVEEVTQNTLQKFLNYSPATGEFTWKLRVSPATPLGKPAGSVYGTLPDAGYVQIMLFGKTYQAHRLAWLYTYGTFPEKQIDHIDHNRTNNALSNLRESDQHTNMKNKTLYRTNSSGYAGVEPHGSNWKARIGVDGTKVLLGVFCTFEEAVAARKAAEKLLNYHKNHGLLNA